MSARCFFASSSDLRAATSSLLSDAAAPGAPGAPAGAPFGRGGQSDRRREVRARRVAVGYGHRGDEPVLEPRLGRGLDPGHGPHHALDLGAPELRRGVADAYHAAILPEHVGVAIARDMLFTGRRLDAQERRVATATGEPDVLRGDDGHGARAHAEELCPELLPRVGAEQVQPLQARHPVPVLANRGFVGAARGLLGLFLDQLLDAGIEGGRRIYRKVEGHSGWR